MTAVRPKKRTSDEETEYTRESKSARKREAKRYEQLGRDLVMLGDQDFEKLDFGDNDELRSEMLTGRRLRGQYESFRRQMMHVGRLLMTCDISELEKELRIIQGRRTSGSAELHRIEKIREDLIGPDGSAALNDIMGKCPSLDRSKIRALIKKAHAEEEQGRPPAASRSCSAISGTTTARQAQRKSLQSSLLLMRMLKRKAPQLKSNRNLSANGIIQRQKK